MKICPKCGTQYTDPTLSFCLQDGNRLSAETSMDAPTVALDEEEMTRISSGVSGQRVQIPVDNYRSMSGINAGSQTGNLRSEKKPIGKLVALTVLAILGLALLGSMIVYFILQANVKRSVATNSTVTPTPITEKTPISTPGRTPSPKPSGTPSSTPDNSFDASAEKEAVNERLENWSNGISDNDLAGYIDNYAPTVDYYTKIQVSRSTVKADKARAFSMYSDMTVNLSNVDIMLDASGKEATVVLDKEWNFVGDHSSTGKVRQSIKLKKIDGQWLIAGERDVKVYYKR